MIPSTWLSIQSKARSPPIHITLLYNAVYPICSMNDTLNNTHNNKYKNVPVLEVAVAGSQTIASPMPDHG